MHLPPDNSLAEQIAELRRAIEDSNLTAGRIYDPATGVYVPLATLAFGRDSASAAGAVNLSTNDTGWTPDPAALTVWAQVFSGSLLVTAAAKLTVAGNKATMSMSWEVFGPTVGRGSIDPTETGPAPSVVASPSTDRALSVLMDDSGQSQSLSAGYPYLHTGLSSGWYRVRPQYNLIGAAGQPTGISGSAIGRTILAEPR